MTSSFKSGKKIVDNLLSSPWSATANQTFKTLRRQQLSDTMDFGSKSFSILMPRSLQVLSNCYIRVELDELDQGDYHYKKSVGKYIFSNFRLLSAGSEVYSIPNLEKFWREFQEGLNDEDWAAFSNTHLGGHAARSNAARVCYIPVPLFHSRYTRYPKNNNKTYGVLPMKLGSTSLELVFDVSPSTHLALNDAHTATLSIANKVSLEYREVISTPTLIRQFQDGRGSFSTCFCEQTRLLPEFIQYSANVKQTIRNLNCTGSVFQIEIYAVSPEVDSKNNENETIFVPTAVTVRLDNETCINLADPTEVNLDSYSHGLTQNNSDTPPMFRINFNSYGCKSTYAWYGALDFRGINQMEIDLTFADNCKVMLFQRRYARIVIAANGRVQKYLD